MRLGSQKLESHKDIQSLFPDAVANSSPSDNAKSVESVSFDPCI